jgi:hypothetical protein
MSSSDHEPDDAGGMTEAHAQSHRDVIKHWEDGREHLVAEHGAEIIDDLIELQRMAFRLCRNKQHGLAVLLSLISELWAVSDGEDSAAMEMAIGRLKPVVDAAKLMVVMQIMAATGRSE